MACCVVIFVCCLDFVLLKYSAEMCAGSLTSGCLFSEPFCFSFSPRAFCSALPWFRTLSCCTLSIWNPVLGAGNDLLEDCAASDLLLGISFLSKSSTLISVSRKLWSFTSQSTHPFERKCFQCVYAWRSIISILPPSPSYILEWNALNWHSSFATERCRPWTHALIIWSFLIRTNIL